MSSVITSYCNKLETIPQFSGTCWFNSILMIMLYSQDFRKELKRSLKGVRKSKYDKLLNFLLYMLRNYNDLEKLKNVYDDFNNIKLKPEYLLYSFINLYDKALLDKIRAIKLFDNNNKYAQHSIYIHKILNTYNIKYLDFLYNIDNNIYTTDDYDIEKVKNSNILFVTYNKTISTITDYNMAIVNKELLKDIKNKNDTINIEGYIYIY
jgi:hypothetical protein